MSIESDAIKNLAPGAAFGVVGKDITNLVWHSPDIDQPTGAAIQAEITRLQAEQPWNELRQQRNRLIAETDWEIVKHKELGTNVPTALKTYRQALRDLPANTTDPANPVWPTKPGGAS